MEWNGYWLAVISHQRPKNVVTMRKALGGAQATWYIDRNDSVEHYKMAGAERVACSGGLVESRNQALDDAFHRGLPCIQLSDDLKKLRRAISNKNKEAAQISFAAAVDTLATAAQANGARLAGCAPTDNAFYFNPDKPVHSTAFIVGDFILVYPCQLRFDDELPLKEDYDYTLNHLSAFGRVARCNSILASFAHRTNAGGAVAYRTDALEQQAIQHLKSKWGDAIKDNPRRPNEILMRWKGAG